jgi:glutamate synthase (ferredoxin)
MMRVCHLNTCPVGVATQDPVLRQKFTGKPEYVVNYFRMIAEETRELMAKLGFRTVDEMVGQRDKLDVRKAIDHWKAQKLDLTPIFYMPSVPAHIPIRRVHEQDHGLDKALDNLLLELAKDALQYKTPVELQLPIRNANRTVGTILGSEVTRRYGAEGLPDDTIKIRFAGSAGQSFGAFLPRGIGLTLEGDANDYFGKGLSGGRLVVFPPAAATFDPEENIIVGNVVLYGATSGEVFIRGVAGERFAVRNSGAIAVVEGVGDHGCEYMTGGRVVVLGRTGRNFAAGMSGGVAYVLDADGDFAQRCNLEMVDLEALDEPQEEEFVRELIARHVQLTKSSRGQHVLDNWTEYRQKLVKIMPLDYRRVLADTKQQAAKVYAMVQRG